MNFQGTAWNWGGWWEPIGVGREARGSRRGGEWWEKPLGPLGPHWEGRWRRWPSGRGREKMTSSFELRFVTLQGIWNFRLLQEWPAEYLQPWVPCVPTTSYFSVSRTPIGWRKSHFWGVGVEENWTTGRWSPRRTIYSQRDHKGTSNLLACHEISWIFIFRP